MNPASCRTTLMIVLLCIAPCAASADEFVVDLVPFVQTDPGLAEVTRLEKAGRVVEAVAKLDRMKENRLDCSPDHIPAGVADFMAGSMLDRAGMRPLSVERYRAAASSPLGDIASWRLGNLLSAMGDRAGARSAYASVSTASSFWFRARMQLAAGLLDEGRPEAASSVLRSVLETELDPSDSVDARLMLAEASRQIGDLGVARAMARAARVNARDSARAARAGAMLETLGFGQDGVLEILGKISRAGRRDLKNLDVVARKRPATFAKRDPALPDVVRAAYALASRSDPERAVRLLDKAYAAAVNRDVKAFALYLKGDALVDMGDDVEAARVWTGMVSEYPGAPFAAKAGFSGARAWMRAGFHSSAVALLRMVEERVPAGGSSLSLRWERALAAMIGQDLPEALIALDSILAVADHGDGVLFGLAERARYFRGVILHDMGAPEEGRLDLERVARSSEYSWYGILARSRLESWYGVRFEPSAGLPSDAGTYKSALPARVARGGLAEIRGLTVTDRAAGAVFLLRMGDRGSAEAELVARARRGLLNERDLVLLGMFKASRPEPAKAMRAATWLRGDADDQVSRAFAAAWPRPFNDSVEKASADFNLDPAVIYGVMRVESRFNPSARSSAGAYGLMQVMRHTARAMLDKVLRPAGISASLRKPSGNIVIGAALLDRLIIHFDGYLPLVLAAYNAGSGSGRRFMRTLGNLPTDLLVEAIPYSGTRDYVKRVTGFIGAYRYLYGGSGPLRPGFSVPVKTGPWIDVRSAQRPDPEVVANPGGECVDEAAAGSGLRPRREPAPVQ